jgi:hypothetical protein
LGSVEFRRLNERDHCGEVRILSLALTDSDSCFFAQDNRWSAAQQLQAREKIKIVFNDGHSR